MSNRALGIAGVGVFVVLSAAASCGARTPLPVGDRDGEGVVCSGTEYVIPQVGADIDMHVLLDSSGSMLDPATGSTTKWQATVSALQSFFQESDAVGLGVGLTYFPYVVESVPEMCGGAPASCGVPDACIQLGLCLDSGTTCQLNIGCQAGIPGEECTEVGFCELAPDQVCSIPLDVPCPSGLGACIDYAFCENRYACDVDLYSTPVVPVEKLPEAGGSLLAAMQLRVPEGSTTTLPALQGIHTQAKAGAEERPNRRQVVILGTDGLPTSCDESLDGVSDDLAIQHLAEVAQDAAANGIRTFVVGVFSAEEAESAQENLDTIAKAGGAEVAFIVTADNALSGDFASALEEVRISAATCEYPLPAESEVDLDEARVELRFAGATMALEILDSASDCDEEEASVYVVEDPSGGPDTLVLCPSICAVTRVDAASVVVQTDCRG